LLRKELARISHEAFILVVKTTKNPFKVKKLYKSQLALIKKHYVLNSVVLKKIKSSPLGSLFNRDETFGIIQIGIKPT